MPRGGDREHPLQAEIPALIRIKEGQNKATRSCIDVNRNLITRLFIIGIECTIQRLHIIIQPRPGHTTDRHHADRILVAKGQCSLCIKRQMVRRKGYSAQLDLPQLTELFPHHLIGRAHHQIGLITRLSLRLTTIAPTQPCRYSTQHTRLRRTDTEGTGLPIPFFGSIPQVGQDVDTTTTHHRHARILGLINVIYRDGLIHQACRLLIHVGCYKGCQIQLGTSFGVGLILHHAVSHLGRSTLFGNTIYGSRLAHRLRCINVSCQVVMFLFHACMFDCLMSSDKKHKLCQTFLSKNLEI